MIRHLLATTALATFALAASGAFSAEHSTMASEPMPVFSDERGTKLAGDDLGYFTAEGDQQILASSLIGAAVYSGTGEDAESVGDVNDVVMAKSGTAEAVVIGVGGFLGVGEKDVAIDFERLTWIERDGERWLTIDATKEELEQAPEYDRMALRDEGDEDEQRAARTDEAMDAERDDEAQTAARTDKPADEAMDAEGDDEAQTAVRTEEPAGEAMSEEQSAKELRATLTPTAAEGVSAEQLIGATVYDRNNNSIGEIGDVIVTGDGEVGTFIVDVGGFLGIGEKPVAVDIGSIEIMSDDNGALWVFTPFSGEQLEGHVAYSEEEYQRDPDSVILR